MRAVHRLRFAVYPFSRAQRNGDRGVPAYVVGVDANNGNPYVIGDDANNDGFSVHLFPFAVYPFSRARRNGDRGSAPNHFREVPSWSKTMIDGQ